jgi:hypothetical protein
MRASSAIQQLARGAGDVEADPAHQCPRNFTHGRVAIRRHRRQQFPAARRQHTVPLEIRRETGHVRLRPRACGRLEQRVHQNGADASALFPRDWVVVRAGRVGPGAPPLGERAAPDALSVVQTRKRLEDRRAPRGRGGVGQGADQTRHHGRLVNLLKHA